MDDRNPSKKSKHDEVEESGKIGGVVVLIKRNLLGINDVTASVVDRFDEILGRKVALQLITTLDQHSAAAAANGIYAGVVCGLPTSEPLISLVHGLDIDSLFNYDWLSSIFLMVSFSSPSQLVVEALSLCGIGFSFLLTNFISHLIGHILCITSLSHDPPNEKSVYNQLSLSPTCVCVREREMQYLLFP